MKNRILFFMAVLLFQTYCYGQVYVFVVCGSRGENSVNSHGQWELLKTKSTIDQFDQIKTSGDNCYLGLLHTSGRSIVIQEPGIYKAEDLLKKVTAGNTAIASKYADFVYTKMTTISSVEGPDKRRGENNESIVIYIPRLGKVFGNEALIRWSEIPGDLKYRVRVKNIFDDLIAEFISNKNKITIDLSDPKMSDQDVLIVTVELENNPGVRSEAYGITRLSTEQYQTISETIDQLKADLVEDSPLNNLIYASFFEENQLLIDAATNLEHAIEYSPGVSDFEKLFEEFLVRNGLK